MVESNRLTIVMIAEVPQEAISAFEEYENHVLPLLDRHGGTLERRLRATDTFVEVHIVSFGSRNGYASYLADPERMNHGHFLDHNEIGQRVLEMRDV